VDAGVDGVNVVPVTTLGRWDEWVDYVVPILQRGWLAQCECQPGSLRHKLFGRGDHLPETHHGRQLTLDGADVR
jgi:hypothetical protein